MSTKAPIAVISYGKFLKPADAWAAEQIDALPRNKRLNARITEQRSLGQLGWYWAGLALLVDNFDDADREKWPNSRKFHKMVLEALGYFDKIWRIDGTYRIEVDSIAFDEMTEDEFQTAFEAVRAFVVKQWGYDPWDMWKAERDAQAALAKGGGR